ncbi:MAG TPA: peptide MFS transporter [Holophagaceae bacterium]|nr:peptide MFS transporter [Holophagaceae bacterium]
MLFALLQTPTGSGFGWVVPVLTFIAVLSAVLAPTFLEMRRNHPKGLRVLFFVEMWERFSYYGMRALLLLYMTADLAHGGLGWSLGKASVIYGTYTMSVYAFGLPGGWIADRFIGYRKAVFIGGLFIALGQFALAFSAVPMFFTGLSLIIIGTGLLKTNSTTLVGQLYPQGDPRRDGGFSIYYVGINLGAFISPLICGWFAQDPAFVALLAKMHLATNSGWHWGFAAGGVAMIAGLIQYALQQDKLGNAEPVREPSEEQTALSAERKAARQSMPTSLKLPFYVLMILSAIKIIYSIWAIVISAIHKADGTTMTIVIASIAAIAGLAYLIAGYRRAPVSLLVAAIGTGLGALGVLIGFSTFGPMPWVGRIIWSLIYVVLTYYFISGYQKVSAHLKEVDLTPEEWKRLAVVMILFVFATLFWAVYEQAGSTLNLFADKHVSCSLFGWKFPSTWYQSVNSFFIFLLAPAFAWLWVKLAAKGKEPSSPAKFSIGVFLVGAGMAVLIPISKLIDAHGIEAGPLWLIGVYFLHTVGELCLSPVGLSLTTKLAPHKIAGMVMGLWFWSMALGNLLAGLAASLFINMTLTQAFEMIFGVMTVATVVLIALTPSIKKLMGGVH